MMSMAGRYGKLTNQSTDTVLSFFTGIFFVFIGLTRLLGNVISSVVLKEVIHYYQSEGAVENSIDNSEEDYVIQINQSQPSPPSNMHYDIITNQSDPSFQVCGANHCPFMKTHSTMLIQPDMSLVYVLMGIYLACNVTGVTITAVLPDIKQNRTDEELKHSPMQRSKQVLLLCKNTQLQLLIFPFLVCGMVRAMNVGSFTQSFVSCVLGTGMVGYAMMCDGVGFALMAFTTGHLSKYIPRVGHIVFVSVTNIAIAMVWLLWKPTPATPWVFFLLATIQGGTNGIWKVQTMALTGITFKDHLEAGYAHVMIWACFGNALVFGYNNFICFNVKTYIFLCVVVMALCSYLGFHQYESWRGRQETKREQDMSNDGREEMQSVGFLEEKQV